MDMSAYVATSTAFAGTVATSLFNGVFGLLYTILPFAIGFLIFWMGYAWARKAIGGR